jgi:aerobic carbon-monoxide dehydrogenase medium subunit
VTIRDHLFPSSIPEALEMLGNAAGTARLIGGGTDLVVTLRGGEAGFEVLVDTGRIPDLDRIELSGNAIRLGARVTMTQAEADPMLQSSATALTEGAAWVGGPQIRNRATIVGNVVSAQPAADTAVPLFCLEAELEIASRDGRRTIPIEQAYRGVGESAVDPSREMVVAVSLRPHAAAETSAYVRMMRRRALTLPVLSCAVRVAVRDGRFGDVRIALGPVAATPVRVREAEEHLQGLEITPESIARAAEIARKVSSPRSSALRGGAEYRKDMVPVLVREALVTGLRRLGIEVATP